MYLFFISVSSLFTYIMIIIIIIIIFWLQTFFYCV